MHDFQGMATARDLVKRLDCKWLARSSIRLAAILTLVVMVTLLSEQGAHGEYGDVVLNNYSDKAGMRPVVFPHWFHRIRFRCNVCHTELGFEFKAGGNDINMLKIFDGEYCGACHNGKVAWGVENCILCHSGKNGSRTRVHNSTVDRLIAPPSSLPTTGARK